MFQKCKMMRLKDGSMVQSIPKLIPFPSVIGGCHQRKSKEGIPGGHRICRIPYCDENLCNNGWCEETMVGYNCTCSSGFQGRHCDEMIIQSTTEATTKPTMSPTSTISERSYTTTSQNTTTSKSVTTEAKTKSAMSPTATVMPERSEATTSQETTTSISRIIDYGRGDQDIYEAYDHGVSHNDIARNHRYHMLIPSGGL
ncbi:uncharacterized protein LOC115923260 [Strongylocentrotus purpuratus]|uniref:EGF-like domain-containing protein n=1 Tax=Strongylocentrotus purpuratus TaxID=7668 RepID=A0A7M7SXY7_STRPU|nr:uncharacterized protein LOC115923260 [Strongylocentrotus purpuratus]